MYLGNQQLWTQFGSLAKYAIAHAQANGTPDEKAAITADANAANITDDVLFPSLGYVDQGGDSTTGPIESEILRNIMPGLFGGIMDDTQRQADVTRMGGQIGSDYQNLRNLLAASDVNFDANTYFRENPAVGTAWSQLQKDNTGKATLPNGQQVTASQFAALHYETTGRAQGAQPAYTSNVLEGQQANADRTAATITANNTAANTAQLTALQSSVAALRQNLQGDLAEKATALQQMIQSYTNSLNTLDASQRQNLATQITAQQQNLEDSISAQRTALENEVAGLRGNNTEAATARTAALDAQLAQLTAAQAPMADARVKAAEALTTSINLGLQTTQDQLRADNARQGFIGGSTAQDSALARATIGARQDAATQMGNARVANAGDTRQIQFNDANSRYSLADALAGQNRDAANLGTTGQAQLSAALATGRQGLGDTLATGNRTIGDTTAGALNDITKSGAQQTYSDVTTGADADRAIKDALATGNYNLATTLANQNRDTANQDAAARAAYFDTLYPNAINSAQVTAGLAPAEAAARTSIIPYGTAGTQNALNLLNWWSAPGTAPTTTTVIPGASTATGNGIATLGGALIGSAYNIGSANNWWKQPTVTTTPTPAPVTTNTDSTVANLW